MSATIVTLIEGVIERLDEPLDPRDAAEGWTDDLRLRWRAHFVQLRATVAAGERPVDDAHHLMRWLNFEGIRLGPLADQIRDLQEELMRAYGSRLRLGVTGSEAARFLHQLGIRR